MPTLQTAHPRLLNFYSSNPAIDFEAMNLLLVDFLEKVVLDTTLSQLSSDTIPVSFQAQMFHYMKQNITRMSELTDSVESIKSNFHRTHQDMVTTLLSKFLEMKNEYIEELKIIVNQQTVEQISPLLERNNLALIDKTTLMINDVVPKSQYPCYQQIHDSIRFFHKSISEDTQRLLQCSQSPQQIDNNNTIINEFISHFEMKSNQMIQNIQQPIYSYISSSEERIHSNLANIKDISMKTYGTQEKISKDLGEHLRVSNSSPTSNTHTPYPPSTSASASAPPPTFHPNPPPQVSPTTYSSPTTPTFSPMIQRNQMHGLLSRLFPTSEISKVARPTPSLTGSSSSFSVTPITNSIYSMKRPNQPKIMVEGKTSENNVSMEEVVDFIELMKQYHSHGVIISHNSGFFSKSNYHIECHDGFILVYVHFVEYNQDKIKPAVDIIDQLSAKFKQYTATKVSNQEGEGSTEWIDKTLLDEINKEYQIFVSQKEAIIQNLRESQRKIVSQIEEFKFVCLDQYLSSKFTAPLPKNGHRCDLCKVFNANNLKALAAHKRGCIRKNPVLSPMSDLSSVRDTSFTNHFLDVSLTSVLDSDL
jgi:hypothetical protein